MTCDGSETPAYPYYLGTSFHGNLDTTNISPIGNITIPQGVTCLTGATAITQAQVKDEVIAFPSLVTNAFTLRWDNTKVDRLLVTDMRGQIISDIVRPKATEQQFNTSNWADGIYNCALVTEGQSHSLRIVVQH